MTVNGKYDNNDGLLLSEGSGKGTGTLDFFLPIHSVPVFTYSHIAEFRGSSCWPNMILKSSCFLKALEKRLKGSSLSLRSVPAFTHSCKAEFAGSSRFKKWCRKKWLLLSDGSGKGIEILLIVYPFCSSLCSLLQCRVHWFFFLPGMTCRVCWLVLLPGMTCRVHWLVTLPDNFSRTFASSQKLYSAG